MGIFMLTIVVASGILYIYARGVVDAEYLSLQPHVRSVSEVLLPILLAISLSVIIAGLLLTLFLPQKIAGPIYRIEQDLLQIRTGDLTKTINVRCYDILKDLATSVNMAVADIGNMVKDVKETGNVLETKIIEGKPNEIKKAFELHKKQLERIITRQ
jgi:methyl-accepting chemotaxis protein